MEPDAEEAFRAFVRARSTALVRTAFLMVGDRGEAEDVVQEALSRVYARWSRIEHRGAVESYTRQALLREVLTRRRRRRVRHLLTADVPDVPAREPGDLGVRDEVHRALLELPDRQRAAVVLRFFDDLPEAEVARLLGISTGTVKQHTSRGLARLRLLLADADGEVGR